MLRLADRPAGAFRSATSRTRMAAVLFITAATVLMSTAIEQPRPAGAATISVPSIPRSATAWSGDASAFLRWVGPAVPGAAVTGYRITPIVDGRSQAVRSVGAATATTVTGLANGTSVRFRIAAVTAKGTGPAVETRTVKVGSDPFTSASSWLDVVNYVRQSSRLPIVTENATWKKGLEAHARYLANTPASQRTGAYASAHTENPASVWYTAEGAAAAASADITVGAVGSARVNIGDWLSSPFHAIGLIRPALRTSAYAAGTGFAGIDVIRGLSASAAPLTRPVLLPGPGSVTTARAYDGHERPNPLDSCPGFTSAGLPIVVLLPNTPPSRLTATLKQPDGTTLRGADVCVISARSYRTADRVYGATGKSVLTDSNAVIIIPRTPLQVGRQTVSLIPPGSATITWSFSVAAA